MQGFAYAAKLRFAELLWWLERKDEARRLYEESQALKSRFNERFWMEDEGFLAMALDHHDQLVRSIGSDPGRCLFAGIVDVDLAPRVANRLMQPDLFSGWGIRTLSEAHPAYNPFAYHRGTIWPVENGSLVLGFARYGLRQEMWKLAKAFFETAALFEHDRLPEVSGGHARDADHPFPGLYYRAGWPQAWSASAPFLIVQALLGLVPYDPLETLFLDPCLPDWLPEITIEKLRVGAAKITLRFFRSDNGETNYEIVALEGRLHSKKKPTPWQFLEEFVQIDNKRSVSSLSAKNGHQLKTVACVLEAQAVNGECPCWDPRDQCLYWIDVPEGYVHRFHPGTGEDVRWQLPAKVGSLALGPRGKLIVALRTGIYRFDCETGSLELLAPMPFNPRQFFLNDGKCDRQGRFWVGPMFDPLEPISTGPHTSALLCLEPDTLQLRPVIEGVSISNGLAWSLTGESCTMLTPRRKPCLLSILTQRTQPLRMNERSR